ncbi:MAG TPA: DinB family protein [Terriglobia bacterium]|nr:DinB family protein [Terriglobia bacterium]
MTIIESLLQELEQEAQTTRRVLERVPEDRLAWKPHDKSMSLGQLALHVATTPGFVAEFSQQSPFQITKFTQQPSATSSAELMRALDESIGKARKILRGMDDAALAKTWRVVDGDREMMAMPVGAVMRTIMLNHWYHHRGQLSVYLRQVGALVPSIYGPSADENPFAAQPAAVASA